MITDHDRSSYFGGSDVKFIMGNFDTKTFQKWWDTKLGVGENSEENIYMKAGNLYEHEILKYIDCEEWDRQVIIGRVRVNYDGVNEDEIIEVKTHQKKDGWKMPKEYYWQVQMEMWALNYDMACIVDYSLEEEDYLAAEMDETLPIDGSRLRYTYVKYDQETMDGMLSRVGYLAECLDARTTPTNEGLKEYEGKTY